MLCGFAQAARGGSNILQHIVADMPRELGGIEVGFFAALSEMIARPLAGIAAKDR